MEKRSFLMLLSLSKETAAIGKALMDRIRANVDPNAAPLWVDSKGVGVFISTDLPSWRIWSAAFPETLDREDQMKMKDLLIVQVGPEWEAPRDGKPGAWLNARYPKR